MSTIVFMQNLKGVPFCMFKDASLVVSFLGSKVVLIDLLMSKVGATIIYFCQNMHLHHTAHCSKVIGKRGKIIRTVQSKITQNFNKLNVLESFLSKCDQWHFYPNTRIIEFLSSDQILLVKLKNLSIQQANLKIHRLQF